ncbi:MAG: tripartite tricarboxylate transporter TctB family protein [Rhodospirillales bacterium]|nr:tripartite tricarboxylate transporter TctB family protein [Rhodospirillales bacterium]
MTGTPTRRDRAHRADREHLLFLVLLLAFVAWYLWTATAASPTFSNLILIAPVGAVAIGLLLFIALVEIAGRRAAPAAGTPTRTGEPAATPAGRFRTASIGTVLTLMALFAAFVVAMPYVGFDIATFGFTLATLWLLGERRVGFSLAIALGTATAVSIAALTLLTFPVPLGIARLLWSRL